jgi:acyl carrier protein
MNDAQARATLLECIVAVAPDAPVDDLDGSDDLAVVLEIDSMDLLNIVVAIHERCGVDIPERDYGKLGTLDDFTAYLVSHAPA